MTAGVIWGLVAFGVTLVWICAAAVVLTIAGSTRISRSRGIDPERDDAEGGE